MSNNILAGMIKPLITKTIVAHASNTPTRPPIVTVTPQAEELLVGNVLTITAQHSTIPGHTYTYQWQKQDGTFKDVAGATSNPFVIDPFTATDAGLYRCVVTDVTAGVSGTSDTSTITVNV